MSERTNESREMFIDRITCEICDTYADSIGVNLNQGRNLPRESEVLAFLNRILDLIFPGFTELEVHSGATLKFAVGEIVAEVALGDIELIQRAFRYNAAITNVPCDELSLAEDAVRDILSSLPVIRAAMKRDVQAAFDGDPAAKSLDEVVVSYPGLKAITIQRIAHRLYHKNVPLIPRIMSEYAHRITGIDIHPGAHLGEGVFIDHGTGVVIGETAVIGSGVKIYQGVTIGALSFPKDACGMIIKGKKRHPTIEDDVTIYAGASILGPVTIGRNSVIGGSVWLTESTEPGTKITISAPELTINRSSAIRNK